MLIYHILQIVRSGKLSWMQNKIQFAGKHSQFTVRDLYSLIAPAKFHCKSFVIVKETAKNAKVFHHEQFAIYGSLNLFS